MLNYIGVLVEVQQYYCEVSQHNWDIETRLFLPLLEFFSLQIGQFSCSPCSSRRIS